MYQFFSNAILWYTSYALNCEIPSFHQPLCLNVITKLIKSKVETTWSLLCLICSKI